MNRHHALLAVVLVAGCKKRVEPRADPAPVVTAPLPSTSGSASAPLPVAPSITPTAPPIALPSCTPSPRITWKTSPDDALGCSEMVTARSPLTVTVAKGTPIRLHLRAVDGTAKSFVGTYTLAGAPPGARLGAKSGDFEWIASGPAQLGFAAIAPSEAGLGECATATLNVDVVENDDTRLNLLRWNFYVPLRDAELSAIPSDDEIAQSYWDGESMEMAAARRVKEKREAALARKTYLDTLACGHLPGRTLEERDVDGDGQLDAVFHLEHGASFVLTKSKSGYSVFGKIAGSPRHDTVDKHTLFVEEGGAENLTWTHVLWIHGGAKRQLDLDGANGTFTIEWTMKGGLVDGIVRKEGSTRIDYEWRDGDFVRKEL